MEPFLLQPACKDYLWGGTRLKTEYGKKTPFSLLAETWECSVHPDGESTVASGPYIGRTLAWVLEKFPGALGRHARRHDTLPILVKLIDAQSDLSIQVHPDDAFAQKHEGQLGKTELWYVLDAQEGATLAYGFAHDMTPGLVREAVRTDTLLKHLQRVPVCAGDVFFIEPGTVHAIGGGVLLAEVQESSNVTYRVYDYGRRGPDGALRQLHLDKALSVMQLGAAPSVRQNQRIIQYTPGMARELVGRCRYFQVERLRTTHSCTIARTLDTCFVLLVLRGIGVLSGNGKAPPLPVHPADTIFVPAGEGVLELDGDMEVLCVKI